VEGGVVELDPPPHPAKPIATVRVVRPKTSSQYRCATRRAVFLSRRNKGKPSQTSPNAAVAIDVRFTREAELATPVVTFTVKLAVLPRVREREEGVMLQVAFNGTCVQLNVTAPLESEPDTTESE
jgi:hypothetical protein